MAGGYDLGCEITHPNAFELIFRKIDPLLVIQSELTQRADYNSFNLLRNGASVSILIFSNSLL